MAKLLSDDQVFEIRRRLDLTRAEAAARFGVTIGAIKDVRAGKHWKHVPFPSDPVRRQPRSIYDNYIPVPETGCWLWLGGWDGTGYGNARHHSGTHAAHRLMYEHHVGPIPEGMFLCHKCDTRPCVNPDHLFVGTHLDNMGDMVRKGRGRYGPVSNPDAPRRVERLCEACNAQFTAKPSDVKRGYARFCSAKCRDIRKGTTHD